MADIVFQLEVDDKGTPKIKTFGQSIEQLQAKQAKYNQTANQTGKSQEQLTNILGQTKAPLSQLNTLFPSMSAGMMMGVGAAVAVAAALAAVTESAMQFGGQMADLSDKTGISASELTSLRGVAGTIDMGLSGLGDTVAKMNLKIVENGKEWKSLGITTKDPLEAFEQLKHKIGNLKDPLAQADMASKAFGKASKDLLPLLKMNNTEYDSMKEKTRVFSDEFIQQAAKVDDKWMMVGQGFKDIGVVIGTYLLPVASSLADLLGDAAQFWGDLFSPESAEEKRKAARSTIIDTYAELQAERAKGEKLIGKQKGSIKVNGLTLQESLAAFDRNNPVTKKAPSSLAGSQLGDSKNDGTITTYGEWVADKQKKEASELRIMQWEDRYTKENSNSVDFFGGNETAYRDSADSWNRTQESNFDESTSVEYSANMQELQDEGKKVYNADQKEAFRQRIADEDKLNEQLEKRKELLKSVNQAFIDTTQGPIRGFYTDLLRGNKSFGDSFEDLCGNVMDNFGNLLLDMSAKYTAMGIASFFTGGLAGGASGGIFSSLFHASGTSYSPGGFATVAEYAPEYVNGSLYTQKTSGYLPRGSVVTQASPQAQNTYQITIQGGNGVSAEDIVREIKRYDRENGRR